MSSSNYCFLTCIQISQEADQVVWYSHLFHNFLQFIVIHTVKGFGIVFLELSCFFNDPADVGNLISGSSAFFFFFESSAFFKTSLSIWKFTAHVLLKPGLENFEHYFTRVWDECNCAVVWAFFGIAFLSVLPSHKYSDVKLLNCMIVIFLIFWGHSILFSVVVAPFHY